MRSEFLEWHQSSAFMTRGWIDVLVHQTNRSTHGMSYILLDGSHSSSAFCSKWAVMDSLAWQLSSSSTRKNRLAFVRTKSLAPRHGPWCGERAVAGRIRNRWHRPGRYCTGAVRSHLLNFCILAADCIFHCSPTQCIPMKHNMREDPGDDHTCSGGGLLPQHIILKQWKERNDLIGGQFTTTLHHNITYQLDFSLSRKRKVDMKYMEASWHITANEQHEGEKRGR